jgi:hypothetical protein
MINTAIKHCNKQLHKLYSDEAYDGSKGIYDLLAKYHLTEYDIHKYMAYQKTHSLEKSVGINIIQKCGTLEVYKSLVKRAKKGKYLEYRKVGDLKSFEDKKKTTGIIVSGDTVKICGTVMKLKPVRKNDRYMQEALKSDNIAYCRVVRKPFNKYHYFLQIVFKDSAPKKLTLGKGMCGIDEGTSTIAYFSDDKADFIHLAPPDKYNKAIKHYAVVYDRRRRMANPQCFNEDGTIIKGSKFTNRTKGMKRALFKLKDACECSPAA